MLQPPPTIALSAAGAHGVPGTQGWDGSNGSRAPQGIHGRHGRDATFPSPGGPGGNLHIGLGFDDGRPGMLQVTGEAHLIGQRWELGGTQTLLLDCRGGSGGAGGFGEHGQHGGDGYDGRAATENSEATHGEPGANGGDGGRGTSGASGGPGGGAHITVYEDDTDTLIGIEWDVRGGKGGPAGGHGDGGDGGRGGAGGAGHFWTETIPREYRYADGSYSHTSYDYRFHSRPSGLGGSGGMGGRSHTDPLYPGADGAHGYGQITVLDGQGKRAIYSSRYMLEVMEFEVHDENDDGINEPGEHLIVSNIVVKNTGSMPSPRIAKLQILIRATKWLDPVIAPLELPTDIPPGHSVLVPGILRAFIKNETAPRGLGTLLQAKDTVSLRAYSQRLQRDVPELRGGVDVVYQYPLLMTTPRYLDCVAKGDIVTFSWTIQNISRKPQGQMSTSGRQTGTHLSDPKGMFDLKRADPETPHDIMDMIDFLEPGEKRPITIDFEVSDMVEDFTTGSMLIDLILSDPLTGSMRKVVFFDLSLQVSPTYRYNPAAQFLLVINAQSLNSYIVQLLHFIRFGLHLAVDIFNLSLSGAFITPNDQGDEYPVLSNYAGKGVIILGNTMNYFQNGTREPWELLDVGQAFALAQQGTGFLVVEPTNRESLRGFAHLLSIPSSSPPVDVSTDDTCGDVKDLIRKLAATTHSPAPLTVPVKKKIFRSLEETISSRAKSAQKDLTKSFPIRSFLVAPIENIDAKNGALHIVEGLPHETKLVASLQPYNQSGPVSEYHIAMITHLLPFKDQCSIFWNLAGIPPDSMARGVDPDIVYASDQLAHLRGSSAASSEDRHVSSKACEAISWSIATQLASEITHFCAGAGSGSSSPLLTQLPLLRRFASSAPAIIPSAGALTPLFNLLGRIRAVTSPLGFGQRFGQGITAAGRRRKKVRSLVAGHVSAPLVKLCGKEKITPATGAITKPKSAADIVSDIELHTKKQLVEMRKNKPHLDRVTRAHELACTLLGELTGTPNANFLDVINGVGYGKGKDKKARRVTVMSGEEYAQLRAKLAHRQTRLVQDVDFSYNKLKRMVSKAGEVRGLADAPAGGGVAVWEVMPDLPEVREVASS